MAESAEMLSEEADVLSSDITDSTPQTAPADATNNSSPPRDTKKVEFTSEIFKIELKQLPRYFGFGELKKKLRQLQLDYVKIKTPSRGGGYAYVTFRSEEMRLRALEVLNGAKFKGSELKAIPAKATEDPLIKRRQEQSNMAAANDEPSDVRDAVTPWWTMTYEEQLEKKQTAAREWLEKLARKMATINPILNRWLKEQREKNSGLCCPLEDIVASPVVTGYRNKCEFAIGTSPSAEPLTVGFRLGRYRGGSTAVAAPDECSNVSPVMVRVIRLFEQWLRQPDVSLSSFDPETRGGHWKQLTVRVTTNGAVMVIPRLHPQQLTQEAILNVKSSLKRFFEQTMATAPFCSQLSLFFAIDDSRTTGGSGNEELLSGPPVLKEHLLGLEFAVSPSAFFQVNTTAAEKLYAKVRDWALEGGAAPVLLDVCCGTGTIGLCLAKDMGRVVGIEMVKEAVEDARHNAATNQITNAEFIVGKAEDVLNSLNRWVKDDNEQVVAVVDPPRAGLHGKVVKTLRCAPNINTIVFVSCNPELAFNNFIDLARMTSNVFRGDPFVPVRACAVDLFPWTPHFELVVLLKRLSMAQSGEGNREMN